MIPRTAAPVRDALPRYRRAVDLDEALHLLSRGGWTPLAGGTDFYPARVGRPVRESLLDLGSIEALRGIELTRDAEGSEVLRIGAATTWSTIARALPGARLLALRQAAREIGGVQVQNRATIGGNLCHASPAADGVAVLLALDARLELASVRGRRRLAVDEFVLGARRTALEPDELLVAIEVPSGSSRARCGFLKLGHRHSLVISIAMVAVSLDFDASDRLERCAIAVGACSPAAVRLRALEAKLLGTSRSALAHRFEALLAGEGALLASEALLAGEVLAPLQPIDDVRATATYRRHAAVELARRLVAELALDDTPSAARFADESASGAPLAATGVALRFRVNGRERTIASPASARLSDCLRDELGLTGTKVGCHAGDCGACTVLLDGQAVCSCIVAVGQCAGREVLTVEALAQAAPGSIEQALRRSFVDNGAAQCGICTPGMLMAAVDVLRRHPRPTPEQVVDGLGGVLCRCTGYRKIIEAVLSAAGVDATAPALPLAPASPVASTPVGAAVGARVPRLDAQDKVDGLARYGADVAPADACWLKVLRSPHAAARFAYGDLDAFVAAHPGLLGVVTARDIPFNRFAIFPDLRDQPAIAEGVVRTLGEALLVLVGEREAVEAIELRDAPVHLTAQPALASPREALAGGARALHDSHPDNVLCRGRVARGDVDAAIAAAAVSIDATMRTRHIEHAYIEPEAGYAQWSRTDDGVERVTIFACTQTPYMDRSELASMFALDPSQVRIVPSAVGGGFGGKLDVSIQPLLAAAARRFGRPARIVYTRPESMASTTKRHPARMQATIAADADGRMLAYRFEGEFDTGAYASWGPTVANRVPIHASGPYRVAHVRALTRAVYTNGPIGGAFRGFGVPQSTLLNETLVDRLAERLGVDPLEYRFEHALRAGDRTATGQRLQASAGLQACLAALRPAWRDARARAEAFNAQAAATQRTPTPSTPVQGARAAAVGTRASEVVVADRASSDPHRRYAHARRRGVGVACMWYGIGNTVIANPSSMQAGLRADGRVVLYNGAVDIGQGTGTILPQILADAFGVPLASIDQVCADTDLTLDAGKSSASRQTFVSGNAARLAGEDLRARLLALLGIVEPATLHIDGSVVSARGADAAQREARIDLRTLAPDARGDVLVGSGHFDPPTVPLDADGQGVPYATYGFAAQFAEVEVDVALGTVRVLVIHAAHDVGRAINPTQVEGQIHGGIAQGLGLALMEDYVAGRTDNLHDYLIPTAGDIPPITVHLIEDAEPLGPRGAKGVGEPALVATAPAILNAIHHATGIRMAEVPVTPDRLRAAIVEALST